MSLSIRLFLLAIASFVMAAASDQDLVMDGRDGSLVVSGSPSLDPVDGSSNLHTPLPKHVYLALYTDDGQVTGRCELSNTWKVQLLQQGSVYVEVQVAAGGLTVDPKGKSFVSIAGQDQYVSWRWTGDKPGSDFKVIDAGGTPQCNQGSSNLGTTFKYEFLRISSDAVVNPTDNPSLYRTPSGDPPIPIVGGSLKFYAPDNATFSCKGLPGRFSTVTMTGASKARRLEKTWKNGLPSEAYVILDGASDWRITAYPQQLEITPGWWGAMKFSLPSTGLECGNDIAGDFLRVTGYDVKPELFEIDWSPGWFSTRRHLTVPCRACRLLLRTRAPAKSSP